MKKLQKELNDLIEALDKSVETSTKELGKKSLEYMQKQYLSNKLEGHVGNIKLRAYKKYYKKGFVISSGNDIVAVFNEFGTGITKVQNPLARDAGYEYNAQSPFKGVVPEGAILQYGKEYCDRVTTPDTWWYFKEGKWWWNRGAKAKNMYSSLVDELNKNAVSKFKANISQTIGSYGGK